jgi:hypothetical protein
MNLQNIEIQNHIGFTFEVFVYYGELCGMWEYNSIGF